MKSVTIVDFGKDHWSLFGYIDTLCVDSTNKGIGTIDKTRVRCNPKTHPLHAVGRLLGEKRTWRPEYGTRLSGFWKADKRTDPKRQVKSHDDWDCLNDLEEVGLVKVLSEANGFVMLTDKGREVAGRLRAHKSRGGMFATFTVEASLASAK